MALLRRFGRQGDSYRRLREQMVLDQIIKRGIDRPGILAAMRNVPRERFVPENLRECAYEDRALPIDAEQTISQPYTVAFMCDLLELSGGEKVLEIGTGSGYGAAVLSRMAGQVHTLERIESLSRQAAARLAELGYTNVTVHHSDGTQGLSEEAPFDAIVVTAAAAALPDAYREQLVEGGRIVIPIGQPQDTQVMYRFRHCGSDLVSEPHGEFAFVPLVADLP